MKKMPRAACLRRALAASALSMSITLAAVPASAQIVFDPSNYAQNVLTAARALQQINNQITSLANQAQMLINQAKQLASLPTSVLSQIEGNFAEMKRLMGEAERLAYNVSNIESQFSSTFQNFAVGKSDAHLIASARDRWQQSLSAYEHSLRESLKPLVWGEVFAGGIGGLVARVRSGHEPEPQTARNQINAWCDAHGIPAPLAGFAAPYATAAGDAAALVADDAEVAIIAGHLARLATDVLIRSENSAFPVPAYAIGLRKAWIFSEPFETWPIQLSGSEPWKIEQDSASVAEGLALLRELLPSAFDGHDQPSQ